MNRDLSKISKEIAAFYETYDHYEFQDQYSSFDEAIDDINNALLKENGIYNMTKSIISVISDISLENDLRYCDINDSFNTAIKIIKNLNTIMNKEQELNSTIKSWYISEYYSDELGSTLNPNSTFNDLNNLLLSGKGDEVYDLLGGDSDSVIRERCFEKLADILDVNYNEIYNKWLDSDDMELG